jgi:hypothetical protein
VSVIDSAEVPFVVMGNRRGLTAQQLQEDQWLADFVKRFPDSFEMHVDADVWLFKEPPQSTPQSTENTSQT